MSLRNMDVDLALNRLNELFFLHRYDECVLFLNRLNHITIKTLSTQITIDIYLSRLPYTIEIFESLYSKLFIIDPDNFPVRHMQPERLIDKMISYFSMLADSSKLEPIDGIKILNSFENVIRVISYIQPNMYTRLLYFKYAIDNSLIRIERDLIQSSNHFLSHIINHNKCYTKRSTSTSGGGGSGSERNGGSGNNSNTSTMQHGIGGQNRNLNLYLCDTIKAEVAQTINLCEKATVKLTEYQNNMKTQKLFKNAQYYINNYNNKNLKVSKSSNHSGTSTIDASINSDTQTNGICQDYIQNRLFLNKALMNTIEPYLEQIKLQQILNVITDKIDLDKEILLVYAHLKHEEKYLTSNEPLLPLFKRYSLGYERVIQIWRKKCSADALLNETSLFMDTTPTHQQQQQQQHCNNRDSGMANVVLDIYGQTVSINGNDVCILNDLEDNSYLRLLKNMMQNSDDKQQPPIDRSFSDNNICASVSNVSKGQSYNTLPSRRNGRKTVLPKPSSQENYAAKTVNEDNGHGASSNRSLNMNANRSASVQNILEQQKNEIDKLRKELGMANERLKEFEKVQEIIKEKEDDKAQLNGNGHVDVRNIEKFINSVVNTINVEYENCEILVSADLIRLYASFYQKDRTRTYDALDAINEIQNMNEFKTKLLFSVIVLSFRYVNLFLKDLKRKIRTLLQIDTSSIDTRQLATAHVQHRSRANGNRNGQVLSNHDHQTQMTITSTEKIIKRNSSEIIENALNKYLKLRSTTFDLTKIIDDVKDQLWSTLYDYPKLKECEELNQYINESVRLAWSLMNHEPQYKIDYSSVKYDKQIHERFHISNKYNDNIIQYVWPTLIDTSDRACLVKGIVIT